VERDRAPLSPRRSRAARARGSSYLHWTERIRPPAAGRFTGRAERLSAVEPRPSVARTRSAPC
jgi:hypothetical protein